MHLKTKGNFTGAWIPQLPGGNSGPSGPWHSSSSMWKSHFSCLKEFASSPLIPTINSTAAGRGSVRRGGVKSQAAEARRVHAMMIAVRLLEEFPSCLMELRDLIIISMCYKVRVRSGLVLDISCHCEIEQRESILGCITFNNKPNLVKI